MEDKNLFLISDRYDDNLNILCEDIKRVSSEKINFHFFQDIKTRENLDQILAELLKKSRPYLLFKLTSNESADYLRTFCSLHDLPCLDYYAWLMSGLGLKNGRLRKERFHKESDRLLFDFAHIYDDGKDPGGIKEADICLIGVSRTGKTPLSMYLASRNLRTVNVPLLPEAGVPGQLYSFPAKRIFGLTADSGRLSKLRKERLKSLGLPPDSPYAAIERIEEELNYAHSIMKEIGCPVIDISHRAVEEIAEIIIRTLKDEGLI